MKAFSILFFTLISGVTIIGYMVTNKNVLEMRKKQSKTSLRENALKKSLEENLQNEVNYSKKYKAEVMCTQAGFRISYGEYRLICIACAIAMPILCLILLNNPYLAFMSLFLGFSIPSQVITFIRNRRIAILDKQIGSFLQMVTERYANTKDFSKAMHDCLDDFKGAEPFYSELQNTIIEMNLGTPTADALKSLSKRTGNKYLSRLGDYYSLAIKLGTSEARNTLLKQSFYQFEEDRKIKNELKMAISGPANEAYIMIAFIPVTMIYNAMTNSEYISFMTQTTLGQVGVAVIFTVIIGCLWVVNTKLSAPLD